MPAPGLSPLCSEVVGATMFLCREFPELFSASYFFMSLSFWAVWALSSLLDSVFPSPLLYLLSLALDYSMCVVVTLTSEVFSSG